MKKTSDFGWINEPHLQTLLSALCVDGDEARVVGGAVRNSLMQHPISDIDIATTSLPDVTILRAQSAGFKVVPTGIDFGTVTAVKDGLSFEVTTLRADIETDGRHAKVVFGRDWVLDAERRDFTINALYMDGQGKIYDFFNGLDDLEKRLLRFIGDADRRIEEDYLRILRFFRFFAWYGNGRPDAEGLKACARHKSGLTGLSAERIWSELYKTLAAPDPSRALLWMRQSGVLSVILPESEKWGIDTIHPLVAIERERHWPHDPLLRLEAIVPVDAMRMKALSERLKLSNVQSCRLIDWAKISTIGADISDMALRGIIYREGQAPVLDHLKLALARYHAKAMQDDKALIDLARYAHLIDVAENPDIPVFPLKGQDLIERGYEKGPVLGEQLKKLEQTWLESGFILSREELLAMI